MGVLDQVTQMKREGFSDSEIYESLQQQGISPREISDSLGQAQIKNAIESEDAMSGEMTALDYSAPVPPSPRGAYNPQSQEIRGETPYTQDTGQYAYQQIPQQGAYPQDAYASGGGGEYGAEYYEAPIAASDTDTMMEIAEQVFSEKTKKMKKQIDEINELKALTQTKLDSIAERLKRLESMFDKLQINILEQVRSYGKGFEHTKKEVEMMQDSFGKIVNEVADHTERKHHVATHETPTHTTHPHHHKIISKKGRK